MNVISSSYGNDSMALIQWAHEQNLPRVFVVYCDTGWSAPSWPKRVDSGERLARSYGFKIIRVEGQRIGGMATLVRERKGFPGNGRQFCTSELKIFPFLEYINQLDREGKATVLIGKRRAESPARADTPEFIEKSEIHGDRKVWHPLYMHSDEERNALLARAGFDVLPHRSKECSPCVNANRADFLRLTPGEIERVNDLEVEVSQPMFRAKRFGALGIYGVIQWAKRGTNRGDIEQEQSDCDSLFGCGL